MIRFREEGYDCPFPLSRQPSLRHTDGRDFRDAILLGAHLLTVTHLLAHTSTHLTSFLHLL